MDTIYLRKNHELPHTKSHYFENAEAGIKFLGDVKTNYPLISNNEKLPTYTSGQNTLSFSNRWLKK